MSKFKVGDKVYHVIHGVHTIFHSRDGYFRAISVDGTDCGFYADGKDWGEHQNPAVYTLEEARKMGFDILEEKLKKSKTLWVYYCVASGNFITTVEREPDQVGYIEREVTFEWEEEV